MIPVDQCKLPPRGWKCGLKAGHTGPCPTTRAGFRGWLADRLSDWSWKLSR